MLKSRRIIYILSLILVCLTAYLFGVPLNAAEESSVDYNETVYNQDNGLGSTEVNCLYQTKSGYMWIGTDGGLYRYNGSEFRLFNLWNTDKADVYYINNLFQDSTGSLWVATNNYGLFRITGNDIYHFSDAYYSGVKCVNDVCEAANGTIYIATAYGVYTVSDDNNSLVRIEELAKHNIKGITSADNKIYGIYGGNTIFSIDSEYNVTEKPSSDYTTDELSTISSDMNGNIYIGTIGTNLLKLKSIDSVEVWQSLRDGINSIYCFEDKVYVCTDSGVGYFNQKGDFFLFDRVSLDDYVSDMIIDYEGNFWFSSSKTGLYYLSQSKFGNLNSKYGIPVNSTNCVRYIDDEIYIGTDEGLFIVNSKGTLINNDLTEYMSNVSIRDILQDKHGNIWIGSYRKYGVVKYDVEGKIKSFNKSSDILSNMVNTLYETKDGNIAVGTEDGISIINTNGRVLKNYKYDNGLEYSNVISLCRLIRKQMFRDSKNVLSIRI